MGYGYGRDDEFPDSYSPEEYSNMSNAYDKRRKAHKDEITRLTAEVERLRGDRDSWRRVCERLQTEVLATQGALRWAIRQPVGQTHSIATIEQLEEAALKIAALEEQA